MLPRIDNVKIIKDYKLIVTFEDDTIVLYDLEEDIRTIDDFKRLKAYEMFRQVKLDASRTCIYWNDRVDLSSDTIKEYGKRISKDEVQALLAG